VQGELLMPTDSALGDIDGNGYEDQPELSNVTRAASGHAANSGDTIDWLNTLVCN
jgi:hypothetical protein